MLVDSVLASPLAADSTRDTFPLMPLAKFVMKSGIQLCMSAGDPVCTKRDRKMDRHERRRKLWSRQFTTSQVRRAWLSWLTCMAGPYSHILSSLAAHKLSLICLAGDFIYGT